ncbi:MAG: DUF1684 domain-containing protein, partial [Pseudomonadota bacterium]
MLPSVDDLAGLPAVLQLADWRHRIFSLYAEVRSAAARDPEAAWRTWVCARETLYRTHPQSPLLADVRAEGRLPLHFAYDPGWRIAVEVRQLEEAAPDDDAVRRVEVGGDGQLAMSPALMTVGLEARLGRELTVFRLRGYGGGLFLPFRDGTSGAQTYGGGRYLLDTIKGADLGHARGRLWLDFNFAYHP